MDSPTSTLAPQFQGQSNEEMCQAAAVPPGLRRATAGNGMHGGRGAARTWCVWEGESWFLAHLCVTVPTWSQLPLPPYLFRQIISIIKNRTFPIYVWISSTHLSICEKTHLFTSISPPFVPFPSLSILFSTRLEMVKHQCAQLNLDGD